MLDSSQRILVKATAPILREYGETLTRHFYERMFAHNPELRPMFNQGHQRSGAQQQALATAVAAYAEHIEDPTVLIPVLKIIANKHVSLGIRAEHYPIVGRHLLDSIREVLGEVATDELVEAWAAAYEQLADILVSMEADLYHKTAQKQGGWSGWRTFKVTRKEVESEEITSFYFVPADGGHVPNYLAGQYITVRVFVPELGMMQPRQYSLSQAPNTDFLRISVKREAASNGPAGMVSNELHDAVDVGTLIDLAAPNGDFFLDPELDAPLVLISAGVGITPMLAIAQAALKRATKHPIHFIHACRHGGVHAFKDWLAEQIANSPMFISTVYYESPRSHDIQGQDFDKTGRLNMLDISSRLPDNADYFLCGPTPFMRAQRDSLLSLGIDAQHIKVEAFGSGLV
ncbi:NO-inducible flavohemoprotein [Hydromonas duriensis]|uniref:Flavohemoprotein n=1 Tax=Hydromonas duriensis TaxID=1527608 RepID=A0A4R6Y2C6_9BURK|nr:NO-inducible flavohemoprotein [Hydromonas duriensis]TDR30412.1 nitric oxide dioxygenase [Hydromonas duriensis]